MPQQLFLCDGCGEAVDDLSKLEKVGGISPMAYCAPCASKARAYLKALADIRAHLAEQFTVRRDAVARGFGLKAYPDA